MGIKPIDVQVNLSQVANVAKAHSQRQGHFRAVQINQAHHLAQEAEEMAHTIEETHQPSNDESKVKERKENPDQHGRQHENRYRHEDDTTEAEEAEAEVAAEEEDRESKGHLFDGFS